MASSEGVHVIGIAGAAGAGKSTVARALAAALGNATLLHIDDYQRVTEQPFEQVAQWQSRGADFDAFEIPLLPGYLARLKRGETVIDPVRMTDIVPRRFIVFETHFGRAHRATGEHIDYLVWLRTSADVALARNVRDLIAPVLADAREPAGRDRFAWIDAYLARYLSHVRPLLALQQERVASDADLAVDAEGDVQDAVERIRHAVLARFP